MRRVLFDQAGEGILYLTGAGVFYNRQNQAVGFLQSEAAIASMIPVLGAMGSIHAWFDDAFLWTTEGKLIAFVKGAKAEQLSLPKTKKLGFKPEPKPAPFRPLLMLSDPPERSWEWADRLAITSASSQYYS